MSCINVQPSQIVRGQTTDVVLQVIRNSKSPLYLQKQVGLIKNTAAPTVLERFSRVPNQ